jgi:hypothetical protein
VLPFDSIDTIPIEDSRMMLASHDDPPEEQEEPEPEQPAAAVELPVSIDVAGVRGVGDDGGARGAARRRRAEEAAAVRQTPPPPPPPTHTHARTPGLRGHRRIRSLSKCQGRL